MDESFDWRLAFIRTYLARISHQVTAADANMIKPTLAAQAFCAFAALNAARVLDPRLLDILSSTPARIGREPFPRTGRVPQSSGIGINT